MPDLSYGSGVVPDDGGVSPVERENVLSHLTVADKLLIAVLLLASIFSYAMIKEMVLTGAYAVVSMDNREVGRIRLEGDSRRFDFQSGVGPFVIERKNGLVRIVKTSCPNKICWKMGGIGSSGGVIVCVPGKLLIRVIGDEKSDIDALTR